MALCPDVLADKLHPRFLRKIVSNRAAYLPVFTVLHDQSHLEKIAILFVMLRILLSDCSETVYVQKEIYSFQEK